MEGWSDYYLLDNLGLIIRDSFEWKNGILYEKYSAYLDFVKKNEERKKYADLNPIPSNASLPSSIKVKDFEEIIVQSSKILATELSISPNLLNYSLTSLIHVDNGIKKKLKKIDVGDFEEKYFVPIVAYCGEVIRNSIDGNWKIIGNTNGVLEQILIVEKTNPEYSYRPEIPLALLLSGDAPKGSNLKIEVDAQLHKYGFIKGNEAHYGIKKSTP